MDSYEASLERNAIDSLEESINFLERSQDEPNKIRIAIILLDNFVELFFKSYLAKEHQMLIFERPSEKNAKTLSLRQAIALLEKIGYDFTDRFKSMLNQLRNIRNKLNHSSVKYSPKEWDEKVGEALYYVLEFDMNHNNLFNIQTRSLPELWPKIMNLKGMFERHLKNATNNAAENTSYEDGPLDSVDCPECWNSNVSATTDYRVAHCYFCKNDFEIEQCSRCGTWFSSDSLSGDICDNCWEDVRAD